MTKISPLAASLLCKLRIVLFLALVEPCILQQQDVARIEREHRALRLLADAVRDEADRTPDDFASARAIGSSDSAGSGPSFGRPKCAISDDLRALVGKFQNGRRDALDTGQVAYLAVGHRHVQVDPDEHALALHVADVVERPETGHSILHLQNRADNIVCRIRRKSTRRRNRRHAAAIGLNRPPEAWSPRRRRRARPCHSCGRTIQRCGRASPRR